MKFFLFAHSQIVHPKLKRRKKKGAKLSSPFNLNIPTHAMRKVLLNARPSYAGVSAADHILA